MKIGFFDSGVGGLSVLSQALDHCPGINAVYVGDTAWMPYGTKPVETLKIRVATIINWLTEVAGVDLVMAACNTSAALYSSHWNQVSAKPVIDPVMATAESLSYGINNLGVLATPNTVNQHVYRSILGQQRPDLHIWEQACPGLADWVEQGQQQSLESRLAIKQWVQQLAAMAQPEVLDGIVLGCTHYPFAARLIAEAYALDLPLIDPAMAMAEQLSGQLGSRHSFSSAIAGDRLALYVTGDTQAFTATMRQLPVNPRILNSVVEPLMLN